MLLRKLIGDVEEENSRFANMKLSLEESSEQVPKNPLIYSYYCVCCLFVIAPELACRYTEVYLF